MADELDWIQYLDFCVNIDTEKREIIDFLNKKPQDPYHTPFQQALVIRAANKNVILAIIKFLDKAILQKADDAKNRVYGGYCRKPYSQLVMSFSQTELESFANEHIDNNIYKGRINDSTLKIIRINNLELLGNTAKKLCQNLIMKKHVGEKIEILPRGNVILVIENPSDKIDKSSFCVKKDKLIIVTFNTSPQQKVSQLLVSMHKIPTVIADIIAEYYC